MYSDRERIAHAVRRLGVGAQGPRAADFASLDDAVQHMMSTMDPGEAPEIDAPKDWDEVDYEVLWTELTPWWFDRLADGGSALGERLVWFWHDHFAVGSRKVDHSYIIWQHHRLVRRHAAGSFRDLLHAVATDAAMLWYLDGTENAIGAPNENFGREVMELHTIGHNEYTQQDVAEISRAFSGWVVNEPHWEERGFVYDAPRWSGVFDEERFDGGEKTVLGRTGSMGMTEALDLLLELPQTSERIAAKLYRELVGLDPLPATRRRLGAIFGAEWSIAALVEEIVADPVFVSDEAIRIRIRTPLEKLATILQGFPRAEDADGEWNYWMLDSLHYLPLDPPNPAGFPTGPALLDPARMLGSFQLLYNAANPDEQDEYPDLLVGLGLFDLSEETRRLLERFPRPGLQLGLAFGSPEFVLT